MRHKQSIENLRKERNYEAYRSRHDTFQKHYSELQLETSKAQIDARERERIEYEKELGKIASGK